ncbi:unnamed protein product, partial [Ectocarpus fasciculatus]
EIDSSYLTLLFDHQYLALRQLVARQNLNLSHREATLLSRAAQSDTLLLKAYQSDLHNVSTRSDGGSCANLYRFLADSLECNCAGATVSLPKCLHKSCRRKPTGS